MSGTVAGADRAVFIGDGATARTASSEMLYVAVWKFSTREQFLKSHADELRDSVIEHAWLMCPTCR